MQDDRPPLRVLLVKNYSPSQEVSMLRFADMMASGLRAAGVSVRTVSPPVIVGRLRRSPTGLGKWLGYFDRFILFPPMLHMLRRRADIVHICDHSASMYCRWLGNAPYIVTCHDMLGVRAGLGLGGLPPAKWSGQLLQRWILSSLARCRRVACVSEATRKDLLQLTGLAPNRVVRIYNGMNHPYTPVEERQRRPVLDTWGLSSGQYLLHVSAGNNWYKNRAGALRIFEKMLERGSALKFVMAGAPPSEEIKQQVHQSPILMRAVRFLLHPSNEQLAVLYSGAAGLLFPSLAEGFGWPLIEAQACGCPVFTSDREPMSEIVGSSGVLFDPENIDAAATAVMDGLGDGRMAKMSLANARRFDAVAMAQSYIDLYRTVLSQDRNS